jgi:hypothetical protein
VIGAGKARAVTRAASGIALVGGEGLLVALERPPDGFSRVRTVSWAVEEGKASDVRMRT